jgi:hypothetical protein
LDRNCGRVFDRGNNCVFLEHKSGLAHKHGGRLNSLAIDYRFGRQGNSISLRRTDVAAFLFRYPMLKIHIAARCFRVF